MQQLLAIRDGWHEFVIYDDGNKIMDDTTRLDLPPVIDRLFQELKKGPQTRAQLIQAGWGDDKKCPEILNTTLSNLRKRTKGVCTITGKKGLWELQWV